MQLYDEDKVNKNKSNKVNNIIIVAIIVTFIMMIAIVGLIIYMSYDPNKKTITIDGQVNTDIAKILEFEEDETGKTNIYIPIKDIAPFLGYEGYNGEYNNASEETDKCYVISQKEVAMYSLDSNEIYKLDLTKNSSDYETYYIEDNVFEKNGKLYTTVEGIEKGFNVYFNYNSQSKELTIYTLEYLAQSYNKNAEDGKYSGYEKLDTESLANEKAILQNMLVLTTKDKNVYGVVDANTNNQILEAKYDAIKFIDFNSTFLVTTNSKVGIISKEGKTLVKPEYDSLSLINPDYNLYLAKKGNLYGVIDGNGKEVIYIENEKIGIDISKFNQNGVKNGYILLDKLIPVKQNKKWGFYDIKGNQVTSYVYDEIGCSVENESENSYGLLLLQDYDCIVVQKDRKYSLMNINGRDQLLPFTFDSMYIKISSGEKFYYMKYEGKIYNIIKTIEAKGVKKKSSDTKENTNTSNNINNAISNESSNTNNNVNK